MSIKVHVFASLSEQLGIRNASVNAADNATALEVWQAISDQPLAKNTLIAINQAYAQAEDAVVDNDEVAFFPPVTGG